MPVYFTYENENMNCHHLLDENPKPEIFTMHNHSRYEVYYFLSGKGHFYIEGNEYVLHRGDVLIMRETEAHYIRVEKDVPYERFAFHFDKEMVKSLGAGQELLKAFEEREPGKRNLFTATDFKDDTYISLLRNMMDREVSNYSLQLSTNLYALLNEVRIAFEKGEQQKSNGKETLSYHIISYINGHLFGDLSLDEICERFFISKAQLCRNFKRTTGTTVWGYITVKRLTEAQAMLAEGVPASEVFTRCGFSDYSVFYKAYRKQFGSAPSARKGTQRLPLPKA